MKFIITNKPERYCRSYNLPPEINLIIESCYIEAKTRRLKATWSYEAQQDLAAFTNLRLREDSFYDRILPRTER